VVDVVGLLAETAAPRKYWTDMKRRIHEEGFRELAAKCRQLKMQASDGKYYVNDAADVETLLRIFQSIPSPKAEPVKLWLARVGTERPRGGERRELPDAHRARDATGIAAHGSARWGRIGRDSTNWGRSRALGCGAVAHASRVTKLVTGR
jgi:hypothetical protein